MHSDVRIAPLNLEMCVPTARVDNDMRARILDTVVGLVAEALRIEGQTSGTKVLDLFDQDTWEIALSTGPPFRPRFSRLTAARWNRVVTGGVDLENASLVLMPKSGDGSAARHHDSTTLTILAEPAMDEVTRISVTIPERSCRSASSTEWLERWVAACVDLATATGAWSGTTGAQFGAEYSMAESLGAGEVDFSQELDAYGWLTFLSAGHLARLSERQIPPPHGLQVATRDGITSIRATGSPWSVDETVRGALRAYLMPLLAPSRAEIPIVPALPLMWT